MIDYNVFRLDNGLTVVFHPDHTTNVSVVNVLYKVGSRDENPEMTGMAHLLEHLMFEGSVNIPAFDKPLEQAGGTSNAFTNNDYTNYYIIIPKDNIETALWLDSDRMMSLDFREDKLNLQKNVVIEEYKETVLNQPYGDDYKYLMKLAYKVHPYRWIVIGEDFHHIEKVGLDDVKDFFFRFYAPNNAILSIAGDFELGYIKDLVNKWFGDIPSRQVPQRCYPQEPEQTQMRTIRVSRDVPYDKIVLGFPYFSRLEFGYYVCDIVTDLLAEGDSSRLYQVLVKQKQIFSDIDAYITGRLDKGLVVIEGILKEGMSPDDGVSAIWDELEKIKHQPVSDQEYQKMKNNIEADFQYNQISLRSRAHSLAYYQMLGDAALYGLDLQRYNNVSKDDIMYYSQMVFRREKANVLYYLHK